MVGNSLIALSILFTIAFGDQGLDSINKPPSLLTDPLIPVSIELLKGGLWGSSSAEVDIDSTGVAQSCIVSPSDNVAFDSLVKSRVLSARFSPAIENGTAVPSTVNFQIAVPYDSLTAQCLNLAPSLSGSVSDTLLKISLPKARVSLHFADTTEDPLLKNRFQKYLTEISELTNVVYDGNSLITETDSLGRFMYKLLPQGRFIVSIELSGYEKRQFCGRFTNEALQNRYILRSLEDIVQKNAHEITVFGRTDPLETKVDIAEEEKHTGFSPFLSNVIGSKAEIRSVPEGPSKMLVRLGSPYDNVYEIAGIPMLAPFHFGGHPYADIDGLMISALQSVNVTVNDIAAKRVDASGCIIGAEPGKIKYDDINESSGLYLKGDMSMLGLDLIACYSRKKNPDDFIQAGYSVSNNYSLKWNNKFFRTVKYGNYGIGIPLSYGNATLCGSKSFGKIRSTAFGWFAWDSYNVLKETDIASQEHRDQSVLDGDSGIVHLPWGMGSLKLNKINSNRSLTIGAAHQFFGNGRQVIDTVFSTRTFHTNGELTADFDTIISKPVSIKVKARIDYENWNGYLAKKVKQNVDTLLQVGGKESAIYVNMSFSKQKGNMVAALDLMPSLVNYSRDFQFIGDAGCTFLYGNKNYSAGLHAGAVTSRPDIRGLPDSTFRKELNHTFIASLPLFMCYHRIKRIGVTPYIRYCTNSPQLDYIKQVWDQNTSSPVQAYGADFDIRIAPVSWMELTTALNLARARRTSGGKNLIYEWDLPWTVRNRLRLFTENERINLYVEYNISKGLPYYDIDSSAYGRLPYYKGINVNFQFCNSLPNAKVIKRLDCYLSVKNAQDLTITRNVRDYYWDQFGDRQPVRLGWGRIDFGLRFGLHL